MIKSRGFQLKLFGLCSCGHPCYTFGQHDTDDKDGKLFCPRPAACTFRLAEGAIDPNAYTCQDDAAKIVGDLAGANVCSACEQPLRALREHAPRAHSPRLAASALYASVQMAAVHDGLDSGGGCGGWLGSCLGCGGLGGRKGGGRLCGAEGPGGPVLSGVSCAPGGCEHIAWMARAGASAPLHAMEDGLGCSAAGSFGTEAMAAVATVAAVAGP